MGSDNRVISKRKGLFQGAAFKGDLKYALSQLLEETNYSTIAYDQTLPSKLESKAYIHLNTIKKCTESTLDTDNIFSHSI